MAATTFFCALACFAVSSGFQYSSPQRRPLFLTVPKITSYHTTSSLRLSFEVDDDAPSDYDMEDLEDVKTATVDYNEEDVQIRDALKRELLLLSSVTNRGDYANVDEQNILSKLDWNIVSPTSFFFKSSSNLLFIYFLLS